MLVETYPSRQTLKQIKKIEKSHFSTFFLFQNGSFPTSWARKTSKQIGVAQTVKINIVSVELHT